jgi:hypothetical protein
MTPKLIVKDKFVTIGNKEFKQEPLGLDRTGELFGVIGDVMGTMNIDKVQIESMDTKNVADMAKLLGTLLKQSPAIIRELVIVVLDVQTSEEKAFISENLQFRDVLKVSKNFIEQNDIAGIKADFLELMTMLKQEV